MNFFQTLKNKLMLKFLTPIIRRYILKTPILFRTVTIVSAVASFITGVPELLEYMCENQDLCIAIPEAWAAYKSKVISIAGIVLSSITEFQILPEDKEKLKK